MEEMDGAELFTVYQPGRLDDLVLPETVDTIIDQWLVELGSGDELRAYNLTPRSRVLLFGKPGCGKTSLARNVATRLGMPLILMSLAGIESKYCGEAEKNIKRMFTIAREHACVLFLDEIDCVSVSRDNDRQGEHSKKITIALLQELDQFRGVIISATNMDKTIDDAVWRRFDIHMELPVPDTEARALILGKYLKPFELPYDSLMDLSVLMDGVNSSVLKQLIESLKRDIILSPRQKLDMGIEFVFDRVVSSILPPTNQDLPALWDYEVRNNVLKNVPWPLTTPQLKIKEAA